MFIILDESPLKHAERVISGLISLYRQTVLFFLIYVIKINILQTFQLPLYLTLTSSQYQNAGDSVVHSLPSLTPAPSLHPSHHSFSPPHKRFRYSPIPSGERQALIGNEVCTFFVKCYVYPPDIIWVLCLPGRPFGTLTNLVSCRMAAHFPIH
jgi:hypothetical protein